MCEVTVAINIPAGYSYGTAPIFKITYSKQQASVRSRHVGLELAVAKTPPCLLYVVLYPEG